MATYYLYEYQAEKLRGLKAPATAIIDRAVERYRKGEFDSSVCFTGKRKSRDLMPKTKVSVTERFPGIDDAMMRKILQCHFENTDVSRNRFLDREISRLDKKIAGMMNYFTNKKFIILN